MEKLTVFWTINAKSNLSAIYKYISNDSEYYAEKFIERLILKCNKQLSIFPKSGRSVPELVNTKVYFLKEIIFRNYRIIYNYNNAEKQVRILTVINAKMDLKQLVKTKTL